LSVVSCGQLTVDGCQLSVGGTMKILGWQEIVTAFVIWALSMVGMWFAGYSSSRIVPNPPLTLIIQADKMMDIKVDKMSFPEGTQVITEDYPIPLSTKDTKGTKGEK